MRDKYILIHVKVNAVILTFAKIQNMKQHFLSYQLRESFIQRSMSRVIFPENVIKPTSDCGANQATP